VNKKRGSCINNDNNQVNKHLFLFLRMTSTGTRESGISASSSSPLLLKKYKRRRKRINSPVVLVCLILLSTSFVVSSITSSSLSSGSLKLYRNSKSNNSNNINSSIKNRKTKNWNISSMTTKTANRIRGGDDSSSDGGSSSDKADDDDAAVVAAAAAESTTIKPAAETVETDETNTSSSKEKKEKKPFSWRDARRTLFPIHGKDEVTKFLLMGSIKFFIIMALTLTRDTKDTLVVTQCGAEAIAFLKIYGVLPAATAFIALYSKMSDSLGKKTLFYTTCIPFFIFFIIFDMLIYPNTDWLHPTLSSVETFLGISSGGSGGMTVLASIIAHWTSALFYVVAEIYSSVSVGLLFWQFANENVPVDQAKRFYPLFAQMSGLAPVLAGQYVVRFASRAETFGSSLHRLTAAITFAGCGICFFYNAATSYIQRKEGVQLTNTSTVAIEGNGDDDAEKKK